MDDTGKAIIIGAAILGLAIYASGEPRHHVTPAGEKGAYVLDRQTGAVRWCVTDVCYPTTQEDLAASATQTPSQPQPQPQQDTPNENLIAPNGPYENLIAPN